MRQRHTGSESEREGDAERLIQRKMEADRERLRQRGTDAERN